MIIRRCLNGSCAVFWRIWAQEAKVAVPKKPGTATNGIGSVFESRRTEAEDILIRYVAKVEWPVGSVANAPAYI